MMRFRMFYYIGDYEDNIIIEGETIKEVRTKVDNELKRRGARYSHSIEIKCEMAL